MIEGSVSAGWVQPRSGEAYREGRGTWWAVGPTFCLPPPVTHPTTRQGSSPTVISTYDSAEFPNLGADAQPMPDSLPPAKRSFFRSSIVWKLTLFVGVVVAL